MKKPPDLRFSCSRGRCCPMSASQRCKCGADASGGCRRVPPLCGDCCTPSCGGHLKDARNGYKREGLKRGKNSKAKRKRESQSWQLVRDLHADLLQIPGMEEGLKNRQLTTRQLMRKVLGHYSNSLAQRDSVDPLAPTRRTQHFRSEEPMGARSQYRR